MSTTHCGTNIVRIRVGLFNDILRFDYALRIFFFHKLLLRIKCYQDQHTTILHINNHQYRIHTTILLKNLALIDQLIVFYNSTSDMSATHCYALRIFFSFHKLLLRIKCYQYRIVPFCTKRTTTN